MKTQIRSSGKRIHKRYTPAERRKLVAKYKKSGLTKTAFCRENDMIITTLSNWVKPYKKKKAAVAEFAEIEFTAPANTDVSAEIIFSDGKVLRLRNFQLTEESATFIKRMASC